MLALLLDQTFVLVKEAAMSIYIVSHKKQHYNLEIPDNYLFFYVGPDRNNLASNGGVADGFGDNIASLNSSFCELTALYWIWKNDQSLTKGLVHYRRLFTEPGNQNRLLDTTTADLLLQDYDIILPQKYWLIENVKRHYASHHISDDIERLREAIATVYPQYLSTFDICMNAYYTYPYNMQIAHYDVFNSYCKWLFDILFALRTTVDEKNRDAYQRRLYGFLSERLMNVYVLKNKLKVKETNVLLTESNLKREISMRVAKVIHNGIKLK